MHPTSRFHRSTSTTSSVLTKRPFINTTFNKRPRANDIPNKRPLINFFTLCLLFATLVTIADTARADSFDVTITIISPDTARARVEGTTDTETKAWSLPAARLPLRGKGERVSNFALNDAAGATVSVRKLAPGEYDAERAATKFAYDLALEPPFITADAAHLSWLSGTRGIIFLADLLPVLPPKGRVTIKPPTGWQVFSVEPKDRGGAYEVADSSRSLFVVGQDLRERSVQANSMDVSYVVAGEWAFPDDELVKTSKETLDDYRKVIGASPRRRSMVVLMPFPAQVAGHVWSAETRGGTVLLLSGRLPSKTAALAQLNGALTHELFHLWVPNGLALDGEYGWFYEGFSLYQALRTGTRQGRLTFQDYLTALGRAFDAYKSARGQQELSLIEASERRWTSNPALVYHKGMLVAFLYDLTLMHRTEGKSSLDEVYRELYRRYGQRETKEDASRAVISVLGAMPDMKNFTDTYVMNPTRIELQDEIEVFGLRVDAGGIRTRVVVADSINRRQRDLLRRLGYNERGS